MLPTRMVSNARAGAASGVNKFNTISSLPAKTSASWLGKTFASPARQWPWPPSAIQRQRLGYVTQLSPAFDQPTFQMHSGIKPIYCPSAMSDQPRFSEQAFGQHALNRWAIIIRT